MNAPKMAKQTPYDDLLKELERLHRILVRIQNWNSFKVSHIEKIPLYHSLQEILDEV